MSDEKCPNCESWNTDKEHNLLNLAIGLPIAVVTGVVFYFGDVPFPANYTCNKCYHEWEGDNGCFIATEVYGDKDAPQVQTLRRFRDETLSKSILGTKVMDFYYSGAGKQTAQFIRDHIPQVIPAIRISLDYLVEHLDSKN